jgi:hypothetical protein
MKETKMKHLLSNAVPAGMALAALIAVQPASAAAKLCLNIHDISTTKANRDGTTITFKMRDGKMWRNDLEGRCPDLDIDGFSWVIRGIDQVCENEQRLRVLQSGEVCVLGKFTQITPAPKG